MIESLGIIAGNGDYPLILAQCARRSGVKKIVSAALIGETSREIETLSDVVCWIEVGQLGKLIQFFKSHDITQVVMSGQVTPTRMFGWLKLDLRMVKLLARLKMRSAEPIFSTVAEELKKDGISLIDASTFMKDQLAGAGQLAGGILSSERKSDIAFGLRIARAVADLDIGQTIIVKDRAVVAVEAIEGTDATIRRAGALAGGGTVIVKVSKKKQDMRFDIPVVGLRTLDVMKESGASVLALEAGKTLILDKEKFLARANDLGIQVYGTRENQDA